MRSTVIAIVTTFVAFLLMDAIWLTTTVPRFYRPRMAGLLLDKPNFGAAGLFYILYGVGVVVFVVLPAVQQGSRMQALGAGAFLGLVAYATYDLTNLATMRGFPTSVAVVDVIWGMVATGIASVVATAVTLHFARVG